MRESWAVFLHGATAPDIAESLLDAYDLQVELDLEDVEYQFNVLLQALCEMEPVAVIDQMAVLTRKNLLDVLCKQGVVLHKDVDLTILCTVVRALRFLENYEPAGDICRIVEAGGVACSQLADMIRLVTLLEPLDFLQVVEFVEDGLIDQLYRIHTDADHAPADESTRYSPLKVQELNNAIAALAARESDIVHQIHEGLAPNMAFATYVSNRAKEQWDDMPLGEVVREVYIMALLSNDYESKPHLVPLDGVCSEPNRSLKLTSELKDAFMGVQSYKATKV